MHQGDYWVIKTEEQRQLVTRAIERCELPKVVKILEKQEPRTARQNRFIWGWEYKQLAVALEEAGIAIPCVDGKEHPYTPDILHNIFKTKFLQIAEINAVNKNGEQRTMPIYKSTTELTKAEFSDYIENVKKFALSFWGVAVPPPNRGYWFDYYKELMH